jgi:hypothetical protein
MLILSDYLSFLRMYLRALKNERDSITKRSIRGNPARVKRVAEGGGCHYEVANTLGVQSPDYECSNAANFSLAREFWYFVGTKYKKKFER